MTKSLHTMYVNIYIACTQFLHDLYIVYCMYVHMYIFISTYVPYIVASLSIGICHMLHRKKQHYTALHITDHIHIIISIFTFIATLIQMAITIAVLIVTLILIILMKGHVNCIWMGSQSDIIGIAMRLPPGWNLNGSPIRLQWYLKRIPQGFWWNPHMKS